ncbi:hypothetical protein GPECTOR_45g113 [Gonium pectorale]|uniref:Uncharacterized protein n=1 Tax=Gonium pectorale TaxID=33097 RepID=A0A150G8Z8_GONPE|nr:hypothetical protein GPECTOR_45g113 [Gonium pectorale]|eukprot:KXZ46243.1 hypothetical protein GPECTOR_45g113 [Gonium pectorale]
MVLPRGQPTAVKQEPRFEQRRSQEFPPARAAALKQPGQARFVPAATGRPLGPPMLPPATAQWAAPVGTASAGNLVRRVQFPLDVSCVTNAPAAAASGAMAPPPSRPRKAAPANPRAPASAAAANAHSNANAAGLGGVRVNFVTAAQRLELLKGLLLHQQGREGSLV